MKAPGKVIEGMAYHVQTVEDRDKLAAYETSNYCIHPCFIRYTGGAEPAETIGHTFLFAGNRDDLCEKDTRASG